MSSGSQTQTQTSTPTTATGGGVPSGGEITAVLRLRGAHEPGTRRQIHWAEDVVDNEGLGRKSSKGMVSVLVVGVFYLSDGFWYLSLKVWHFADVIA